MLCSKGWPRKSQIEHRYSFLQPHADAMEIDTNGFYRRGAFPDTETRMHFYERHAFTLATRALDQLDFAAHKDSITHLSLQHAPVSMRRESTFRWSNIMALILR